MWKVHFNILFTQISLPASSVICWTISDDLEAWEVTEFFDDVMNSEFDTVVDDGSTLQVSVT